MKLRNIIKVSVDNNTNNRKEYFVSFILLMLMFVLITTIISMYFQNNYYKDSLQRVLRYDVEQIGFVCQEEYELQNGVLNISAIDCIASWNIGTVEYDELNFLNEYQKGHKISQFDDGENVLEVFQVYKDTWQLFEWKLAEGKVPKEYAMDDNTFLLYMGNAYKDVVSVGDIYEEKVNEEVTYTYVIAGIFERNSEIAIQEMFDYENSRFSGVYNLDYAVVEVSDYLQWPYYFAIDKDADMKEVVKQLNDYYSNLEGQNSIGTLNDVFKKIDNSSEKTNAYIYQLIFAIGLTVLVLVSSNHVIRIITCQKNYGVWYANGATTTELALVIAFDNLIRVLMGLLLAIPIGYCVCTKMYVGIGMQDTDIVNIYVGRVIPCVLVAGMLTVIIISVIPIAVFSKKTPVEMLNGD